MAYVDYGYYVQEYLVGKTPVIPEQEFAFYEKQAVKEVDRYTYGKIRANQTIWTKDVKECICEVAELLYEAENVKKTTSAQGLAGPLVSWSNDGESGSVDMSQSIYTESGRKTKIKEIMRLHLVNTGLLYAGV